MQRQHINSSALSSVAYDAASRILEVEFRETGDVWQYLDVSPTTNKRFLQASSRGNFFTTRIKGKHPERKVS